MKDSLSPTYPKIILLPPYTNPCIFRKMPQDTFRGLVQSDSFPSPVEILLNRDWVEYLPDKKSSLRILRRHQEPR